MEMYDRILIPIDDSPLANRVVKEALSVYSMQDECPITVLHVQSSLQLPFEGVVPINDDVQTILAEEVLHRASRLLEEEGVNHQSVLKYGDPAREICKYTEKEDVDLIVMGSRDKGPIDRFFLGSVSQHIVLHAYSSILVVK
jgi:nucleotide-binding universal stress UspA family protein